MFKSMGKTAFQATIVTGLALLSAQADAGDCKGVQFADQADVHGTSLALNGVGLRTATVFNVPVYVAALYVAHKGTDPHALSEAAPSQLVLHFLRGLSAKQLRDAWKEGLDQEGTPQQLAPLQGRLTQLTGWMEDVKSGQRLIFTRLPGDGLSVALDDKVKGTLPGDDFARAFLLIFLGDHPPTLELKSGLLGGACG